jgi:hypothetical protein
VGGVGLVVVVVVVVVVVAAVVAVAASVGVAVVCGSDVVEVCVIVGVVTNMWLKLGSRKKRVAQAWLKLVCGYYNISAMTPTCGSRLAQGENMAFTSQTLP